jgi:phosphatidylserine/phosphatidylglycerophosphate/cardiolipin synthase-like enzyme
MLVQAAGRPEVETRFGPRVLMPGRNCWRIERAERAALLVDAAAYFGHLERALREARRSIMIIGWDFDGRIRLRPDGEDSPPLGPFLRSLVEARPELEIRILIWSVAVIHAPGAPLPLLLGADWERHPRITLRLDNQHPFYAAHHQKLICIDDGLAFAGGMDLTVRRWDTSAHAPDHPHRVSPDGNAYCAVHDAQMLVMGDAARALGDLARERWRIATGETLAPTPSEPVPWPDDLAPDFVDVPIAIARTRPEWGEAAAVQEVATLTADALRSARRSVYIETQYLTAPSVGELIARSLAAPKGPEIVVVLTRSSRGLLERFVMGSNRDRLMRRLKRADHHDRLRILYPVVPSDDGDCAVLVHSKLMIVDDVFLRVGSSNLNNRSIGLDTECDLAIEASDERARAAIARIRERLLAEHLDVRPEAVAGACREEGSLIRAIERLNRKPRGLRGFPEMDQDGPTRQLPGTWLLDPERPFEPLWFLRRPHRRVARRRA